MGQLFRHPTPLNTEMAQHLPSCRQSPSNGDTIQANSNVSINASKATLATGIPVTVELEVHTGYLL